MSYIIDYFTFDRSQQTFGTTDADQLKGRDRLIKFNSISLLVAGIIFAFSVSYTLSNSNFINAVLLTGQGAVIVFTLKESILQAVNREIERIKSNIKEESPATQYGMSDFKKEVSDALDYFKKVCLTDTKPPKEA